MRDDAYLRSRYPALTVAVEFILVVRGVLSLPPPFFFKFFYCYADYLFVSSTGLV